MNGFRSSFLLKFLDSLTLEVLEHFIDNEIFAYGKEELNLLLNKDVSVTVDMLLGYGVLREIRGKVTLNKDSPITHALRLLDYHISEIEAERSCKKALKFQEAIDYT